MAWTYFVLVMLTGHIVMMALITALLLKNFEKTLNSELQLNYSVKDHKKAQLLLIRSKTWSLGESSEPVCSIKAIKARLARMKNLFISTFSGNRAAVKRNEIERLRKMAIFEKGPLKQGIENLDIINQLGHMFDSGFMIGKSTLECQKLCRTLMHQDIELIREFNKTLELEKSTKKNPFLQRRSLWLFSPKNSFRLLCSKVVNHRVFETLIILAIVISTFTLALEEPLDDPDSLSK